MFDWRDYLELARELGSHDDEASLRSAISRAYYAAFCTARNRLIQQGELIPQTREAHRLVWEKYVSHSAGSLRSVGNDGIRMRRWRNMADYDDHVPLLASRARRTISKAAKLLETL